MRRLLLIIGALAVFSPPTVWGQAYPPPKGIPFRIDPSIDVSERAGWHLNIANGAFDRGELATDIGGASNLGIFGHTPNYADLKNITATYHTHPTATGTQWEDLLGAWHIQGSMAGIDFQMTIPWNNPPPPLELPTAVTPLANLFIEVTGDPRYDLTRTAIVTVRQTRSRNVNSRAEWPIIAKGWWPLSGDNHLWRHNR